ncbi:hypothetical protein AB0958_15315 [Streptomyces sp. NPDC006655]|uniref:hypothetical protein n=1 Tax=Streptomyces sp. NPDC006655 TaxID=3156898 RepID=UPI003455EF3F
MNSENGHTARGGVVLGAAKNCPNGWEPDPRDAPSVRLVDRTDSRERAVLMRAFSAGNSVLTDDRSGLGTACAAVVRSAQRVAGAIAAVDRFRHTGGVLPALPALPAPPVAVVRGVAAGVVEERSQEVSRRPRVAGMWRRLVWPVTAAGALFDAAFMGSVVQQILDVDQGSVQYWLAYLPGLAISVCLLAAGTFLAERMALVREGREAAAVAGHGSRYWWRPLVVPWLFVLAVLGLIVTCGVVRVLIATEDSGDSYLALFQPVVVVLLLLLGIAAVATKLLSHDPEAAADAEAARFTRKAREAERKRERDAEKERRVHAATAQKALRKRMKAADELDGAARDALVAHVTAWFALKAALDGAEQDARRQVEDAASGLVEERARTGMAGMFDFPLRAAEWPTEGISVIPCAPQGVLMPARFEPGPQIRLDLLAEARELLRRHHPDGLSGRLDDALAALDRQWQGPREAEGADGETGKGDQGVADDKGESG